MLLDSSGFWNHLVGTLSGCFCLGFGDSSGSKNFLQKVILIVLDLVKWDSNGIEIYA